MRQNFKFFSTFVKIDETFGHDVRHGCIYHGQIRQEGSQVGYGAVTDGARVLLMLLQHFLQMVIVFADRVRKPGRALTHQQFPLGHGIVILTKYSRKLFEHLEFVFRN